MRAAAIALALAAATPAAATPLACANPCEVRAYGGGYLAPVQEIRSGTRVLWRTDDASHPTADSSDVGTRCFIVAVGEGVEPVPVRFSVASGALRATTDPGGPDQSTRACRSARALPSGGFELAYGCMIHPWMTGALLVGL